MASPRTATRWLILQKARRHSCKNCSDCSGARGFRCCFTPLSGCFSPFPHGTGSLSVAGECSALEGGPPGFDPDSTWPGLLGKEVVRSASLRLRGSHPVPPAFPGRSAATPICHRTRGLRPPRFGRRARSLAATSAISVDFSSSGYLDVSVPRVASSGPILFGPGWRGMTPAGFPHSGTRGSQAVCASPRTIAACRALLRLPAPRHPPRAHTVFASSALVVGFPFGF